MLCLCNEISNFGVFLIFFKIPSKFIEKFYCTYKTYLSFNDFFLKIFKIDKSILKI